MEALQKYIDSLPNSLPKAEQKKLLKEYKQTHSEEVVGYVIYRDGKVIDYIYKK